MTTARESGRRPDSDARSNDETAVPDSPSPDGTDPEPEREVPRQIRGLTAAASGTYALVTRPSGSRRTLRRHVHGWGIVLDDPDPVALVEGDGGRLLRASELEGFEGLWVRGESYCSCGRRAWHHPSERDDVSWCEECAGEILLLDDPTDRPW